MQLRNTVRLATVILGLSVLISVPVASQAMVMKIVKDTAATNHYPGMDGLIANSDDVVSSSPTAVQGSAPNDIGSYSHNAFSFGSIAQDPALPTGYDAITFVEGTVVIDEEVFANGGGAIVTALNITSGTEPFAGHGDYSSNITSVNSGTYNPANGAFTLDVDFSYFINGSVSNEPGVVLSGTAIFQESSEFGTPTGNAYFDDVVVPLAQAAGAKSAVFINGTGQLTNLGYPIFSSVVAIETDSFSINAGLNDAWVSADAAFQGLIFTIFEDISLLFMAWFTYDSVPPDDGTSATFGAADQRWVSGGGTYAGNSVTINVELTSGGIFNGSEPMASQQPGYGTITIVFIHCDLALLTYNFPGPGLSGQITLSRVVTDNVALCKALSEA